MKEIEKMDEKELLSWLGGLNSDQLRSACEADAQSSEGPLLLRLQGMVFERLDAELGADVREGEERKDELLAAAVEAMDIPTLYSFLGTL
jgi:hypothetical protein